jgi:hypothetical protein
VVNFWFRVWNLPSLGGEGQRVRSPSESLNAYCQLVEKRGGERMNISPRKIAVSG